MQSLGPRHPSRTVLASLVLSCCVAAAQAQSAAPAPTSANDPALIEKAHKEGDKVFKWIILADKPRKSEVKEAKAPAPAPAPRPAPVRVKDEGITERVTPILPPSPAPAAVAAAPAPVPAAAAPSAPAEKTAVALAPASAAPSKPEPPPAAEEEEEDLPLVLVKQVDPEFPPMLMRRYEKGSVRVRFAVEPDGTVKTTEVLKTTQARLNEAAQQAVTQWQFKPLKHTQYGIVELAFDMTQ